MGTLRGYTNIGNAQSQSSLGQGCGTWGCQTHNAHQHPPRAAQSITLVGVVSIDGKDAYEIKWSDKKSIYYSVDDFLKLQSVETNEVQGQIQSATTSYGEFKAVEGILFPHLIKQNMGPQKIDFNIKSISLNEPMEDSLFE